MSNDQQAERLEQATAEAREVLREIHSASKDLRNTLREARELLASDIAEQIVAEVERGLKVFGERNEDAMRRAVAKIHAEFDKLGAILLGVDQAEPLEDMVRKVAAMPGRRSVEGYSTTVRYDVDVLERHSS